MGKKITRSCTAITTPPENDFVHQGILDHDEVCSIEDEDMKSLKANGAFPSDRIFRSFDPSIQLDFVSSSWVCFHEHPFSLVFKYNFSGIDSNFFQPTKFSYIHVIPIIWRILYWIERVNLSYNLDIGLTELAFVYDLSTFGSFCFLLRVKTNKPPVISKTKHNDGA